MNEYTVTINNDKHLLKVASSEKVNFNDTNYSVELSQLSKHSYLLKINDNVYQIISEKINNNDYLFSIAGHSYNTTVRTNLEEKANEYIQSIAKKNGTGVVKSPMPGLIVQILKQVGDNVEVGEPIILLEAMKMENEIRAIASGKVKSITAKENSSVEKGETLLEIG